MIWNLGFVIGYVAFMIGVSGVVIWDLGLRIRNSGFVSRDLGFATVEPGQDADAYTSIIAVVPPLSKNSELRKWESGIWNSYLEFGFEL